MRKVQFWLLGYKFLLTKLLRLILLFGLGLLMVLSFTWQPLWAKIDSPKVTTLQEYPHHVINSDRANAQPADRFIQSQISDLNLLQQGQRLYQDGQFSAAIKIWQQAVIVILLLVKTYINP